MSADKTAMLVHYAAMLDAPNTTEPDRGDLPASAGKQRAPLRTSAKHSERQREILRAFRAILVEDGYANLSMRRVAERCGMQLGNLQHYFRTRDELVIAFVKGWIRVEFVERQLLSDDRLAPIEAALKWVDDAFMHLQISDYGRALVEVWAMARHDETTHAQMAAWYAEQSRFYGGLIRRANPALSAKTAEQRAMMIMAMFEGLTPQMGSRKPTERRLSVARKALRAAARVVIGAEE